MLYNYGWDVILIKRTVIHSRKIIRVGGYMNDNFKLEEYLSFGVQSLIKNILKASIENSKETAFMLKYARKAKKAEKQRHSLELIGEHIPAFIIASITKACNLHCSGCYDRANTHCNKTEMNKEQWSDIFLQAEDLGVSVVLLAGGEPLTREDVIREAAGHTSILFPVFTNGTMINNSYIEIFDKYRNLIPIVSIEGNEVHTDLRRGKGIYAQTIGALSKLKEHKLLFGVSITVTKDNIDIVTSEAYLADLYNKGCRGIVYVEYVPFEKEELSLGEAERNLLSRKITEIRSKYPMVIISFPGDEQESGGCLAAGRGFFHINAFGDAEPCPFSPVSDTNLKNTSLREALKSPLFLKLADSGILLSEHVGGCTLFRQKEFVNSLISVDN